MPVLTMVVSGSILIGGAMFALFIGWASAQDDATRGH